MSLLEERGVVRVVAHLPDASRASDIDMEVIQGQQGSPGLLELRVTRPSAAGVGAALGHEDVRGSHNLLRVQLPAAVDDARVKAKFDAKRRQLTVTFAVL